jgi:hypothetical protein
MLRNYSLMMLRASTAAHYLQYRDAVNNRLQCEYEMPCQREPGIMMGCSVQRIAEYGFRGMEQRTGPSTTKSEEEME